MKFEIIEWESEAEDSLGKSQKEVFYALINGKERALSKSDLVKMIKTLLPERGVNDEPRAQPLTPEFAAMKNSN